MTGTIIVVHRATPEMLENISLALENLHQACRLIRRTARAEHLTLGDLERLQALLDQAEAFIPRIQALLDASLVIEL